MHNTNNPIGWHIILYSWQGLSHMIRNEVFSGLPCDDISVKGSKWGIHWIWFVLYFEPVRDLVLISFYQDSIQKQKCNCLNNSRFLILFYSKCFTSDFFLLAIKECLERDLKEIQSKLDYRFSQVSPATTYQ
jgi:hypothetical protein